MENMTLYLQIAILLCVALFLCGCPWMQEDNSDLIQLSGNFEVDETELSFKIPGRLASRTVNEGDIVTAGLEIARLDAAEIEQERALRQADVDFAQAAVAELEAGARPEEINQAEAMKAAAQAKLDELLAGSRAQEIQAVADELEAAKTEVDLLRREQERVQRLFEQQAAPEQKRDTVDTAFRAAQERLSSLKERYALVKEGPRPEHIDQARAALRQAEQRHALVVAGPRAETLAQGRARLAQTQAALGLAQVHLANAVLTSPCPGVVLSKNLEPGEYAAPGTPVVTVGDLSNIYLRAYIAETELGRVKLGETVEVRTDTFPDKSYTGKVVFISSEAEFTPKSVQTEKERVKLVYRIKIDVDNPEQELKPGMPASAVIHGN